MLNSGDPLAYPVFGLLYGRPNGGKSWFSEIAASSMFGAVWKQLRGATFTANRVLGLREQLGAIPLLNDDVNRDRFTREVPDLVKFDRERSGLYAPVILSTNKQVSAVSPDIRKRAVVCIIDAAIPDQQSASKEIAHRAHANISTALLPCVSEASSTGDSGDEGADHRAPDDAAGLDRNFIQYAA